MSESVAGLILVLLCGLALVVFAVLMIGPVELVGLWNTFNEAGIMAARGIGP